MTKISPVMCTIFGILKQGAIYLAHEIYLVCESFKIVVKI